MGYGKTSMVGVGHDTGEPPLRFGWGASAPKVSLWRYCPADGRHLDIRHTQRKVEETPATPKQTYIIDSAYVYNCVYTYT